MSEQPRRQPDPALALLEIYDTALPEVYGYLLSRCRDATLAQDLTAETFLAAVGSARRAGTVSVGWLIGMTTAVDAPAHTLGCYLAVDNARRALDFYVEAFGAHRHGEPYLMEDGRIGHAELSLGDSVLMLADEFPEIDLLGPRSRGGPSQSQYLRVGDVDATVQRAVEAGARLERAPADYSYGRNGVVVDPFGHRWIISSSPAPALPSRHGEVGYLTYAVPDAERAKAFYGAVLGWRFSPGRVENGWHIEGTAPRSGMWGGAAEPGVQPLFHVEDLDAALAAVRAHGGQAGQPAQQPYGRSAECTDDQGARFWLLQS